MNLKIISGGQTGVDRAALDAARELGVEAGGWCPEARKAEDGTIPGEYPVQVLPGAGYRQRTRRNVIDSDGTLIVYFRYLSGGTQETLVCCLAESRPYLLLDGEEVSPERGGERVRAFVSEKRVAVLNVAGPRASGEERAYEYTRSVLRAALQDRP